MKRARFVLGGEFGDLARDRFRQRARQNGLAIAFDMPGLIVAIAPGTPAITLGEQGLVLGALFVPGAPHALETLPPAAIAAILGSAGRHLLQAYWGGYVAILLLGEAVALLRAPFGDLPCLWTKTGDGLLAASDIDALSLGGAPRFAIDQDAVARQLIAGDLRQDTTCISGIEEVRGGDRLTIARGAVTRERLWSPWTFVAPARRIDDAEEAARRLRDQAVACVTRRTGRLARPLLLLSGGLDSSITAACLAAAGRDFACLNLMTTNPTADERDYARAVATRIGRPLVERDMASGQPDIERLAAVRLPRPVARSFEQHVHALALDQAAAMGCDGLVDGGGGDNVFCSLQSPSPAADAWLDPAGRPHFWRLCRDIGLLADTSHWKVAWRAIARARQADRPFRWTVDLRYLAGEVCGLAGDAVRHPWLDNVAFARPGRAAHIALLVAAQGYVEDGPHGTRQCTISPLVSQPLVEHCLRVPSWDWFAHGRNRATARRAFEPLLPPEIVWRRSKGSPNSFVALLFETNRLWIRDHLGSGVLAAAGLLDRDAIIAAIDDPRPPHGTGFGRLLKLADTESWARGILADRAEPF
ncbi:asparagine synthase-related protein [Sphingomonas sp.]|uniref:asparagine synthase-related protein n=1 Tax=Sphingomonas sp. TaxID=28214 RepID=UPI003D6D03B0